MPIKMRKFYFVVCNKCRESTYTGCPNEWCHTRQAAWEYAKSEGWTLDGKKYYYPDCTWDKNPPVDLINEKDKHPNGGN